MPHYAIYNRRSGAIEFIFTGAPNNVATNCPPGQSYIEVGEGIDDDSHYIKNGVAVKKGVLSPNINVDGLTAIVTGIPKDVSVFFDGQRTLTDDDPLELEVDEPGTYKLVARDNTHYRESSWEITFG